MKPFRSASRRRLLASAGAGLLGGLAGCTLLGGPQTVVLGPRELSDLLARRFPIERRLLEVLDVAVTQPRLGLLPERHRLALMLDVAARDRLFGGAWLAHLSLDTGLRWEPKDASLRLQQVRVTEFSFDGAETLARREQAQRLAAVLAERVLEDIAIYRLSAERIEKLQRQGVVPAGVDISARGVEISFTPVPH